MREKIKIFDKPAEGVKAQGWKTGAAETAAPEPNKPAAQSAAKKDDLADLCVFVIL